MPSWNQVSTGIPSRPRAPSTAPPRRFDPKHRCAWQQQLRRGRRRRRCAWDAASEFRITTHSSFAATGLLLTSRLVLCTLAATHTHTIHTRAHRTGSAYEGPTESDSGVGPEEIRSTRTSSTASFCSSEKLADLRYSRQRQSTSAAAGAA